MPRNFPNLYHGTAAQAADELDKDGETLATPSEQCAALINALRRVNELLILHNAQSKQIDYLRADIASLRARLVQSYINDSESEDPRDMGWVDDKGRP